MLSFKEKPYLFILGASIILFILNNIILGSIIPRLPGGSAFGITTMFTITFISLTIRRFGYIPIVYSIYGSLGIPSHLLMGDWSYLLLIILLVVSAAIFDWFLYKYNYRLLSFFIAFPFFIVLTNIMNFAFVYLIKRENPILDIKIQTFTLSLLLGYLGIVLAYLCIKKSPNNKFV
jgi:hypothetical protein